MVEGEYISRRGDIAWLSTTPCEGNDQSGRLPVLVLSPKAYNEKTSLALLCPITSKIKGNPFEVTLPRAGTVAGVVLADKIKTVDWRTRRARFEDEAAPQVVGEVLDKIKVLLE